MKLDISPDQLDGFAYDWQMTQQQIVEWVQDHDVLFSKAVAMIGPLLAIGGIVVGAKHSLRVYIAQSQAPAPDKILPATANPDGTPSNPTRLRRLARFLTFVAFIGAVEGLLLFVLPAYPAFADGFWMGLVMFYGLMTLIKVSFVLRPSSLRLTRTNTGRYILTRIPHDLTTTSFLQTSFSTLKPFFFLSLLNLWLLSSLSPSHPLSSSIYATLIGAAITTSTVARFQGPKVRMKPIVAFLGLYPVLFLGPLIAAKLVDQGDLDLWRMIRELADDGAGAGVVEGDVGAMQDAEKRFFGASEEVSGMLALMGKSVLMGAPGWLAAIALRFDYSIHLASDSDLRQPVLELITTPAFPPRSNRCLRFSPRFHARFTRNIVPELAGVILPSALPSFKKPMFTAVMVIITTVWIGLWGVMGIRESVGIVAFSLPVVAGVMITVASMSGVSKAFWGYSESWWLQPTPTDEPTTETCSNGADLEKAQIAAFHETQAGSLPAKEDKLIDVEA